MNPPRKPPFPATPEDHLICRVLRGEAAPWPDTDDPGLAQRFLDTSCREGLGPLLHHHLRLTPHWDSWPAAVREKLAGEARMQAAVDMLREGELVTALTALANIGVEALLLKGAALAYTHYPQPALRSRCDNDILISPAHREAATATLEALGYRRPNAVSGAHVSYQDCFQKRTGQVDHVIDLHWQVNNGQVFAQALTLDELRERSIPIQQLCAVARTLDPPHALLFACMHRAGHLGVDGPEGERLIWLYDIHLLASALSPPQWSEFASQCAAKNMRRISADALACAQRAFATPLPSDIVARLEEQPAPELSAKYLAADRRTVFRIDLEALPTWKDRIALVRELLLPPADYVLEKYGARSRWLLPWWYLRRAVEGARKLAR